MKTAIIQSSQFIKYNRMDAHFHIAIAPYVKEIERLEKTADKAELIEFLLSMPKELKVLLKDVVTGSQYYVGHMAQRADAEIKRHPFVAAILIRHRAGDNVIDPLIQSMHSAQERLNTVRSAINQITMRMESK